MGARALVAVERAPGEYALYRSQWGGTVLTDPEKRATDVVADAVASGRRLGARLDAHDVLDAVDSRHEALLVAEHGTVTAYLVAPLGLELAGGRRAVGPTALVPVTDPDAVERLRQFLRITGGVLGDAVDAGLLSERAAVALRRRQLCVHPDVPAATLWLDERPGRAPD